MMEKLVVIVTLVVMLVIVVQSKKLTLRDSARNKHRGQADTMAQRNHDLDEIRGEDENGEPTSTAPLLTEVPTTVTPTASSTADKVMVARKLMAWVTKHETLINELLSRFEMGKGAIEALEPRLKRLEDIIKAAVTVIKQFIDDLKEEEETRANPFSEILTGVLEKLQEKYPGLDLQKIVDRFFADMNGVEKRHAGRKMKTPSYAM